MLHRGPTHGLNPACSKGLLMEEKCITNSAQVWCPGRWFQTNSGVLLYGQVLCSQEICGHPGPWRMLAQEGAAALANRGQRLHSFDCQESPWRLHPANQNSKLFNSSAAGRAERAPRTWCGRTEEPESLGGEQHGSPRQQASGVAPLSASKAAGGFGVLANRGLSRRGGAPSSGAMREPPRRPSGLAWPESYGSSSPASVPRNPAAA